jgi:excisionase family DNA binding protein
MKIMNDKIYTESEATRISSQFYTIADAAKYLKVSQSSIRRWIVQHKIECMILNTKSIRRSIRFTKTQLDDFLVLIEESEGKDEQRI